jgi:N-acetylglucosamine-6-phosphate deacetylase
MIGFLGLRPEQALAMATRNVASLLGIAERKGVLQPGADADLLVLDRKLSVRAVYARGVLVP